MVLLFSEATELVRAQMESTTAPESSAHERTLENAQWEDMIKHEDLPELRVRERSATPMTTADVLDDDGRVLGVILTEGRYSTNQQENE